VTAEGLHEYVCVHKDPGVTENMWVGQRVCGCAAGVLNVIESPDSFVDNGEG
jgi:hypothetical protein